MSIINKPVNDSAAAGLSIPNELTDMIGGRLERVARLDQGSDGSVLFRNSMASGHVAPLHSHADPECVYVLSGRLEVFLLDSSARWHPLPAGRSIAITDGIKHAIRNPSRDAAELMIMTNSRLAAFFKESGRPATPGSDFKPAGPEDIERVVRVARAYGYWLSSPAEHAAVTGDAPSPPVV